jgi:hypothetical protein
MKTIRIAFFRAKYGGIVDKLIGFFSRGEYSHAEVVFADGRSCLRRSKTAALGLRISATPILSVGMILHSLSLIM